MGRKNPEPKWQKNKYDRKNHHMETKKKRTTIKNPRLSKQTLNTLPKASNTPT
jgi:hypothetical protein